MKTCLLLCWMVTPVFGQLTGQPTDAQTLSKAGSFAVQSGSNSLMSNPAGLELNSGNFLGAGLTWYSSAPGVSSLGAGYARMRGSFYLGLDLHRTGNEIFNYQHLALSAAHTIGNTSLGTKLKYIQLYFDGARTISIPSLDIGVITQISEKFKMGLFAGNITRSPLSEQSRETHPLLLAAGMAWQPSETVTFAVEHSVLEGSFPFTGFSCTYQRDRRWNISFGTGGPPVRVFAGMFFRMKRLEMQYGSSFHQVTGSIQSWIVGSSF